MTKSRRNQLLILSLIIIVSWFVITSSNNNTTTKQILNSNAVLNQETQSASKIPQTTNNTEDSEGNKLLKNCSSNFDFEINQLARPLWKTLKDEIYSEGIRYPVLQLAISRTPPIRSSNIFNIDPFKKLERVKSQKLKNLPLDDTKKIFGTLLTGGIDSLIQKVESGDFPAEILSETGGYLVDNIISFSSISKNTALLPSKDEIRKLVSYGTEITFEHYLRATKTNAPVSFLEILIEFGPVPQDSNFLYDSTPLDIAAQNHNFELMQFWLNQGLLHNNKLHGGNFSDSLFSIVETTEELHMSWDFLQQWNQFPIAPKTAKTILSNKSLLPNEVLKLQLEQLANKTEVDIKLTIDDQYFYQKVVLLITENNQVIQLKINEYSHCEKKIRSLGADNIVTDEWVVKQLNLDKTVEEILIELSKISPFKVDAFRFQKERGRFKPKIQPSNKVPLDFISEDVMKAFGFAMTEDWGSFNQLLNNENLGSAGLLQILSERSMNFPNDILDTIKERINSLPSEHLKLAARTLQVEQLENMQLDYSELNQLDSQGKNLFYYAVEKNNTEMMQWLSDQSINLNPDPYGSDPMDVALRWNSQPQTLRALCSIGFPIKQRHQQRFLEIQKDDPNEAREILESCPDFNN